MRIYIYCIQNDVLYIKKYKCLMVLVPSTKTSNENKEQLQTLRIYKRHLQVTVQMIEVRKYRMYIFTIKIFYLQRVFRNVLFGY